MAHLGVVLPPTVRSSDPHSCEEGGCQMQPRFHVSTRTLLTYPCKASLRRTLTLCACMSALPFAARVAQSRQQQEAAGSGTLCFAVRVQRC